MSQLTKEVKEITEEMLKKIISNVPRASVYLDKILFYTDSKESKVIVHKLIDSNIIGVILKELVITICKSDYDLLYYLCVNDSNNQLYNACVNPLERIQLQLLIESYYEYGQFEVSNTTEDEDMTDEEIMMALQSNINKIETLGPFHSLEPISKLGAIASFTAHFKNKSIVINYNYHSDQVLIKNI